MIDRDKLALLQPEPDAPASAWAARIGACWLASVEAILEVGRLLMAAKEALPHGAFQTMIESELPFTPRTAQMLMAIGNDPRLSNAKHVSLLPPSWGALYELHKLPDEAFAQRIQDGTIRPDIERSEVVALRKAIRSAPEQEAYQARVNAGCTLEDLHALADDGYQAGAILADPNWDYETWSDKGRDRSPDQHYDTDPLAAIKSLPVQRLAAKNSALHLWCMDWQLPGAMEVIDEWGFKLINVGFIWVKQNPTGNGNFMGLGHWTRNGAELCLLATKGHPIRRSASVRQVITAPVGRHSEKPEEIFARVEALSGGPYLELFARKTRDNWICWGDEIPRASFASKRAAAADYSEAPAPADPSSAKSESDQLDIPAFLRRPVPVASPRLSQSVSAGRGD